MASKRKCAMVGFHGFARLDVFAATLLVLKVRPSNLMTQRVKQPNCVWLGWARHLDVSNDAGEDPSGTGNVVSFKVAAIQDEQVCVRLSGSDKFVSPCPHQTNDLGMAHFTQQWVSLAISDNSVNSWNT